MGVQHFAHRGRLGAGARSPLPTPPRSFRTAQCCGPPRQGVLDILTKVTAPPLPPISFLANAEFHTSTKFWVGAGSVRIFHQQGAGLSPRPGRQYLSLRSNAMRVEASPSGRAEVYQQTNHSVSDPPGRYLISLRRGRTYTISFLARAERQGQGLIRVRLADVTASRNEGRTLWTSDPVPVSRATGEFSVEYRHAGTDVDDARLAFLFGERNQVVLLDRIAMSSVRGSG